MNRTWDAVFDKVYVVSLRDSTARRLHIEKHLPSVGLEDFEWHDATPRDDASVLESYDSRLVKAYPPCFRCGNLSCDKTDCNNVLVPEQVAVFLTYINLLKKISARGQRALVLEDDVFFVPSALDTLGKLVAKIQEGGLPFTYSDVLLLRLGWARSDEHRDEIEFSVRDSVRMSNPCFGITPKFAEKALNAWNGRIETTADIFIHKTVAEPGDALTVLPPLAHDLSWSTGKFESLIHPKSNHVEYLIQDGNFQAAADAELRLAQHIKHMFHRRFLITGHPRTGTGYAASLLRQLGFDIGHESDGIDGISSWMFPADQHPYPFYSDPVASSRKHLTWDYLLYVVRDPSTAVPSIMRDNTFSDTSYSFRQRQILEQTKVDISDYDTNFERAVVSLIQWTKMVRQLRPDCWFRVEDGHDQLIAFLKARGLLSLDAKISLDLDPINADKLYQGQKRELPVITEFDWQGLSDGVAEDVRWYCDTYGYLEPFGLRCANEPGSNIGGTTQGLTTQFLTPAGWLRSQVEARPVRENGMPLPWFTYGAIEFLHQTVHGGMRVFEYGAGYSTLWWQRAALVTSVDHDSEWVKELRPSLNDNVTLTHIAANAPVTPRAMEIYNQYSKRQRREEWPYSTEKIIRRGLNDEQFIAYAAEIESSELPYDVIVIDGMARRLCVEFAVHYLSESGFIVFDNSNRSDYDAAYEILEEHGFKQIPFWGLVPGANFITCTSIFLRQFDILPNARHHRNSFNLPEF